MTWERFHPGRFILAAVVLCALLVFCATVQASEDGAADARVAIGAKDFYVMHKGVFGDGAGGYDGLDSATGLPAYCNGLGCLVLDQAAAEDRKYVAEFNAVMLAYLRENGLPSNNRRQWVRELNQPIASFKRCVLLSRRPAEQQITSLTLDGAPAVRKDEGYTVKIETLIVPNNGNELKLSRLYVLAGKIEVASMSWECEKAELFWGPDGSDAAYLHWTEKRFSDTREYCGTLDLRVGKWIMRQEIKPPS